MTAPGADPQQALDAFPHLHVRPAQGWVNDPNGIGRWDDRWHVMFQLNPHAPHHGNIHWGHMSSVDLVHWRDEPVALQPRPGTIDAGGVWSGVATVGADGEPVLWYSATPSGPGEAGVAAARRDATGDWVQSERWVAPHPTDPALRDVRDPFLVTLAGHPYAVQGAGTAAGTPLVLLYDRTDEDSWQLLGPFFSGEDVTPGMLPAAQIWECPQLIQRDDAWLLVVSWFRSTEDSREEHGVSAVVGDVDTSGPYPRFRARAAQPLDAGPDFYAPQLAVDPDSDRILAWAWSWEGRGEGTNHRPLADVDAAGWAGTLTFPREITVDADHRVRSAPARELVALRHEQLAIATTDAAEQGCAVLIDLPAWEVASDGTVEVVLSGPEGDRPVWQGGTPAATVRILVDGSILEAFQEGTTPTTIRAYPAAGERWTVRSTHPLTAWSLRA